MKQLNAKQTKWLKIIHLLFVCGWVGGALSLVLGQFLKGRLADPEDIYAVLACLKLIDDWIIIPAAMGSLLTGLVYSLFTSWGFWKHGWVAVKWVITVTLILFGTFYLGPWINGMEEIARAERALSLSNERYLYFQEMNTFWGSVQLAANIFLLIISVLKPWKNNQPVKASQR